MVLCMAFLVPAHPYFGLPIGGKPAEAAAGAFEDDATVAEMAQTGSLATKQSV